MPNIHAIIFDLDDTLYPERAYAFSGFAAVAAAFADRLGDAVESATRMRALFDTEHRPRVFNELLESRGFADPGVRRSDDARLVRAMIETYRNHAPMVSLHPDAEAALTRLNGAYRLGLITDGPAAGQRAKIAALDLAPRLDQIVVTAELGAGHGKPNPVAFELICRALDVSPTACAYVGDNATKDFVAPNALGWMTVQIVRPDGVYRGRLPTAGGTPDKVITTLDELDAALE